MDGVEKLRSLFKDLKNKGVALIIITKGYVGAVNKLLHEEGLLIYVDSVIGSIGIDYGENDYDKTCKVSDLEGNKECRLEGAKKGFIQKELERRGLTAHQAVLVEDD